ncbi:sugar kinase [Streptomyces aurantiogriseus]|uniref:Carbohydrate kinase n=1 Tax=Streptomyces aurantiogriseus TaxID=66870 RepID=A0A918F507_9ACTN|nr:sugar kinase [Streptomyces aurantiogriseus]GGR01928.1 carbohydrate kinase [Streptomyces aurantiogriseus]
MTATGSRNAPDVVDVVALGESMVTFLPSRPGRLADVPSFDRAIGGAESNVACVLATAGHAVRWVSRVGTDGFGDHLVETIGSYGVDVASVRRDPDRPTGVYFRTAGDRATDAHEVAYYRAGSAASAMAVGNVDLAAVRAGRVLHLSGITAALSPECRDLLWELTEPGPGRPLVSFDVNHRPGLWRDADGAQALLELARRADLVFVGDDEARAVWGLRGSRAVREALPEPEIVVVKQGEGGAIAFGEDTDGLEDADGTATSVRAPRVDVVAAVGAGDAFAAGFLSATLRGLPVRQRLRHGHLMAAAALTVPGDLAAPPSRDHADRLAALDDDAWGRLRLGPGWTRAAAAPEEVRTP